MSSGKKDTFKHSFNFNIQMDDFLRLSKQLTVSIPEELRETFQAHQGNLEADLQKIVSHSFSETYKANEKELKKNIDNVHANLYQEAWKQNDETIEGDLVKTIQKYKNDDEGVVRVKVPQKLAGVYERHKEELKKEVKEDELHILEEYKESDEEEENMKNQKKN